MMKKLTILLAGLAVALTIQAQSSFDVSYQTALPLGDMTDHIDQFSWRGMGMEYQYFLDDYMSLGFHVGWNVFNENTPKNTLYEGERNGADVTVRGKQFRYVNAVPWYLTVSYYLGEDDGGVRPFGTLGIGGTWIEQRTDIGLFAVVSDNVHFSLNPKIGLLIPIGYSSAFVPSIQYNVAPGVKGGDTFQYISFNVGFKFM